MESNDEDKTLSVAYGNLVGLLVEAIKELKAEVEDMKEPLFSVGEEVILQSKAYPECNGEAVVLDIRFDYEDGLPGYLLTILSPKDEEGDDLWWDESALRKKHKPSELSFQELVSLLNTPIKTPIKA